MTKNKAITTANALEQECAFADMKQELGEDFIEMEMCDCMPFDAFGVF